MSVQSLRDLVSSKRTEIFGMFVQRVMQDAIAPAPDHTRRSALVDHLPAFLDALLASLHTASVHGDEPLNAALVAASCEHGLQRFRLGFDVEALVREYGILRECILEVVDEAAASISVREFAVLSRCLDVGTANAVSEYSRHKDDDVARASHAREEVLAVVSHDLRTPLNAIVMCSHVLASRLPADSREYEVTGAIQRAADEMNRMIRDLLDLASLDAGHLSLEQATESAAALLAHAVSSFAPSAESRAIALRVDAPADLPLVTCDRASMHRVLANLLENALKFAPSGGTIALGAEARGEVVRFSVRDNGPGIPPDLRERVFDRFVRTSDPARRGTGLGLYIAKGLVEATGGTIGVDSDVGAGSTFWFTLPAAR